VGRQRRRNGPEAFLAAGSKLVTTSMVEACIKTGSRLRYSILSGIGADFSSTLSTDEQNCLALGYEATLCFGH
jgi:hypothetical protein